MFLGIGILASLLTLLTAAARRHAAQLAKAQERKKRAEATAATAAAASGGSSPSRSPIASDALVLDDGCKTGGWGGNGDGDRGGGGMRPRPSAEVLLEPIPETPSREDEPQSPSRLSSSRRSRGSSNGAAGSVTSRIRPVSNAASTVVAAKASEIKAVRLVVDTSVSSVRYSNAASSKPIRQTRVKKQFAHKRVLEKQQKHQGNPLKWDITKVLAVPFPGQSFVCVRMCTCLPAHARALTRRCMRAECVRARVLVLVPERLTLTGRSCAHRAVCPRRTGRAPPPLH